MLEWALVQNHPGYRRAATVCTYDLEKAAALLEGDARKSSPRIQQRHGFTFLAAPWLPGAVVCIEWLAAIIVSLALPPPLRNLISRYPRLRIHAAICAHDPEAATDAVLSLRSGALMAGARPLAWHADLIRATLLSSGSPSWEHAGHLLAVLDELGEQTVAMLCGTIASWPQCPGNNP